MITLADAEYPVPMSEIQLKKKSRASFTRRPHRTLLRLMYSLGLRLGDTLALPPVDIKNDEGLIYIWGGKRSKDRGQYTYGDMNIKGISMAHYMPKENYIEVKYTYIN